MKKIGEYDKIIERAYEVIGKKLTTKERKKLKTSQFCGPSKSFPVNDCAHYTAALRLLNRSKFSDSTKKKIHACVMRKGKSLGCVKKEKSADSFTDKEIEALIASDVFETTRFLVEEADKSPGMNLDFSNLACEAED